VSRTRSQSRELAFKLIFSSEFNDYTMDETIFMAFECHDLEVDEFTKRLADKTVEKLEEIDPIIEKFAENWSKKRISKISVSILRLCIYEILFEDNIPISVSINEAVELAKKYATDDDASFINGILGNMVRTLELEDK